ncbi:MAG: hypothetical protein KAU95_01685 [Candidatus Aenigmarchaeota archaeon]|nr:hypothetical protein [Candidatus Aenigmarchaeota archaeon]
MEEKYKVIGVIGLIALRKSELFYKVVNELSKEKKLSKKNKEKVKRHISRMENEMFLSKEEKQNKKIKPNLRLENIGLNVQKVIKELNL